MNKVYNRRVNIGIVGCGAIGSRIAMSVSHELKDHCVLKALYDIDLKKSETLAAQISQRQVFKKTYAQLLNSCTFVIEAVNATDTHTIIRQALLAKKNVLAMSVGKLLNQENLFRLAKKNHCQILIPSGALAGIDAIKAASLANISSITLTTRKPPSGFANSPYVEEKGIHLGEISEETVIFDGDVDTAVKIFPKNINVAATIALACGVKDKMSVRIVTSPEYKTNSHEIEMVGDFGRMVSRTDNLVCPDNPKTSYLAVLSAIQTLKQFFNHVHVGT